MPNFISEDDIERGVLKLLQQQGYQVLNCFTEDRADLQDKSQRTDKRDVILKERLRAAARRLNPDLPPPAIDRALSQITQQSVGRLPIDINREIDTLIREGIAIEYENSQGRKEQGRVRVIDFNDSRRDGK